MDHFIPLILFVLSKRDTQKVIQSIGQISDRDNTSTTLLHRFLKRAVGNVTP